MEFRVLAVGDVCAASGVAYLGQKLRGLKKLYGVDFCVVNGENACVVGITPRQAEEIFDAGADVITLGNHAFHRREIADYLDDNPYILRPANLSPLYSGKGLGVYDTGAGAVAVINLIGRCNMDFGPDNPFLLAEKLLRQVQTRLILVDFHAEATSEKLAFGYWADGRVSAVWGTHTHVPTADIRVLPQGTGYITDLGMTGPKQSVLGVKPEIIIGRMRTGMPARFDVPDTQECILNGCIFDVDDKTGKCMATERIYIE